MLDDARAHMQRLGITNVTFQQLASLADGYPAAAPYDVIIICGAIVSLSEAVSTQLLGLTDG